MDINFETHTSAGAATGSGHRWGRAPCTNDVKVYFDPDTHEELAAVELQDGREAVMLRGSWDALQDAGFTGRLHLANGVVQVKHERRGRAVARLIAKLSGKRLGDRRLIVFKDGDQLNLRLSNMITQPGPSGTSQAPLARREGDTVHVRLQDGTVTAFDVAVWRQWTRLGLPVPYVSRRQNGTEMIMVDAPVEGGGTRGAQVPRLALALTDRPLQRGEGVAPINGNLRDVRVANLAVVAARASKGRDGKIIDALRDCADSLAQIEREVAGRGLPDHQRRIELAWALTTARLLRPSTPYRIAAYTGLARPLVAEMAEVRDTLEEVGIVTAYMPRWGDARRWADEIVPEVATKAAEAAE